MPRLDLATFRPPRAAVAAPPRRLVVWAAARRDGAGRWHGRHGAFPWPSRGLLDAPNAARRVVTADWPPAEDAARLRKVVHELRNAAFLEAVDALRRQASGAPGREGWR